MKNPLIKKIQPEDIIILLMSILLTVYTWTRAALIPITHDEVGTYLGYALSPVLDIIRFTNLQLNNHVLNSLLIKLTTSIFGVSEFSIRLPNLLAHLLYLWFTWKILRMLTKDKFLIVTGFILLNFNPYLLDFFSVARGYGLEISLMILSIYLLMHYQLSRRMQYVWFSLFAGALAVMSNFTFITVYISMIVLINLMSIINSAKEKASLKEFIISALKINLPALIISAGLAILIIGPISRLESLGEFSLRSNEEGFWGNLIRSVIRHSFYGRIEGMEPEFILTGVFQALTMFYLAVLVYQIYHDRWETIRSGYFLLTFLLIIILAWFYLQHNLFGTRYPNQRTALFIYPLFILTLCSFMNLSLRFRSLILPVRTSMVLAGFILVLLFSTAANFRSFLDWQYDADTKQMLSENLSEMKTAVPEGKRRVKLGVYWLYKPGMDYYLMINHVKWIRLVTYRDSFNEKADYYYIPEEFKDSLNKFNPQQIKKYSLSRSVLYRQIVKSGGH